MPWGADYREGRTHETLSYVQTVTVRQLFDKLLPHETGRG